MKCEKLCVLILLIFLSTQARSQKTWDGEAGDSMWHSPKNWFPDGIPGPSDDVLVDNSKLNRTYKVFIGSGDSINIRSLRVNPSANNQIIVEITTANTLPLAMYVQSPSKSIVLEKNAALINHTGANTGNILSLNGTMYISNGGKYVHKTIRGNSYIISKLEVDSGSRKGIVEFDVPGNAGYTLSLSGRKFGSLILSANEALKKSYSGSGSSKLTIEGDLTIGENTSFTSTLSSILQINGDLIIKGTCTFNPPTADSIGRSVVLGGDSSKIDLSGTFKTGINFNQFLFGSKVNRLVSNMSLENGTILINRYAQIFLDSFYVKSKKEISIMQNVLIETANKAGISKDTIYGNFRTPVLKFEDSLQIIYSGNTFQQTGDNLPSSIKSLSTKGGGKLSLSKSLEVMDSISLIRGVILSDSIKKLRFSGRYLSANENAFIDGIFQYNIKTEGQTLFPVGKNNQYAPVFMNCKPGESVQVEYFDSASQYTSQKLEFPVKTINQNEYWKIKAEYLKSNDSTRTIIFKSKGTNTPNNNTYIVRLNDTMHWEMLPLLSNNPMPNTVGSRTNITNTIYTTGTIQQVALANNRFELSALSVNGKNILNWKFDSNEHATVYMIEGSTDGITFINIDSLKAVPKQSAYVYRYEVKREDDHYTFFRIKSMLINNSVFYSNILLLRDMRSSYKLYPNPCLNQLKFSTPRDLNITFWIIENNGKKIYLPYQKIGKEFLINVSTLNKGIHYLIGYANGIQMINSFIKY